MKRACPIPARLVTGNGTLQGRSRSFTRRENQPWAMQADPARRHRRSPIPSRIRSRRRRRRRTPSRCRPCARSKRENRLNSWLSIGPDSRAGRRVRPVRGPLLAPPFPAAESEMRMFQGEAGGRTGQGFRRRLARLIGAWLYFCGWRMLTLAADLLSPRRLKTRLRSERSGGRPLRSGRPGPR